MPTPTTATLVDPTFVWRDHKNNRTPVIMCAAQVTSNTSGAWTLDISSCGFKSITSVSASALSSGTAIGNQNVATLTTVTNATVSGFVVTELILAALGNTLKFVTVATPVYVQVWGNPIS